MVKIFGKSKFFGVLKNLFSNFSATIVKTTGILGKDENNVLHARIGVFWGREDALNVYKPVEPIGGGVVSLPLAELEAVNMALRQVC